MTTTTSILKAHAEKERSMRHLDHPRHRALSQTIVRTIARAMLFLAAAILFAGGPAPAQTTEEKLAAARAESGDESQLATRVAKLQVVLEKAEAPNGSSSASKRLAPLRLAPKRLAPNPKLAQATCSSLDVSSGAPGALVFDDGFEGGDLEGWKASGYRFSPRGALDLEFSAQLQGLTGEALLRIELTSPAGHGYQTLEAPVVTTGFENDAPQTRRVDGYPHPVPVRFAVAVDGVAGGQAVSVPWPLAGTHVVSHGLYGEWTAAAALVDAGSPRGATVACPVATFILKP